MTRYYTDYPFVELGDTPGKIAPVRQCKLISYDGDKYVEVRIGTKVLTVKVVYVYSRYGRNGDAPPANVSKLPWPVVRDSS